MGFLKLFLHDLSPVVMQDFVAENHSPLSPTRDRTKRAGALEGWKLHQNWRKGGRTLGSRCLPSQIIIDRYGDRSTSAVWSNHDSSVLRGSFLAVQIQRRFPGEQFQQKKADTPAFRDMKEAMGPVKIM